RAKGLPGLERIVCSAERQPTRAEVYARRPVARLLGRAGAGAGQAAQPLGARRGQQGPRPRDRQREPQGTADLLLATLRRSVRSARRFCETSQIETGAI